MITNEVSAMPPKAVWDRPLEYTLSSDQAAEFSTAAQWVADRFGDAAHDGFYEKAWSSVGLLPSALRSFLEEFRHMEPGAACLVHGLPIDDSKIGPTPHHWREAVASEAVHLQETMLALCGLALGDPFSWASLQAGRLIQNILPIQGDENRQSGHGSEALLEFHSEDGFHPRRCDYLMLLGLRNPDSVPTIIASVRDVRLEERDRTILSQERYHILPDSEHIRQLATHEPQHPALDKLRRLDSCPPAVSVLFGDVLAPYLRFDRPFMRCVGDDPQAIAALDRLMTELRRVQQDVVVGPGTLLVVDNYRAVHGRRAFRARYDGTDRWMKKLTVSRDLRSNLTGYGGSRRVIA